LENIVLAGDINVMLSLEEKKGGSLGRDPIHEWVEDIILEWDLDDIKPLGGKFTWSNKRTRPGNIVSRLDRILVQNTFLILALNVVSKILPFSASDHKPILLELYKDVNLGPIPFHFSPSWIHLEGFQDLVLNV
jgi:endonuclease/exonuclease/phosphatase family metal-dependent hydrolase